MVTARAAAVPRPWVDRVLAAVPLASIYLWLCVLYGWEAWGHVTPWLNGDELETAQISRSIAETAIASPEAPAARRIDQPSRRTSRSDADASASPGTMRRRRSAWTSAFVWRSTTTRWPAKRLRPYLSRLNALGGGQER